MILKPIDGNSTHKRRCIIWGFKCIYQIKTISSNCSAFKVGLMYMLIMLVVLIFWKNGEGHFIFLLPPPPENFVLPACRQLLGSC